MKPRERKPQKQSARLYLRHHDHRDVIMNNIYHNVLVKRDADGKQEIVWKKYPQNALIFQDTDFGTLDLDREWQNGMFLFSPQQSVAGLNTYIEKYKAFLIMLTGLSGLVSVCYTTKDGIEYKNITNAVPNYLSYYTYKFADDCLCRCSFSDYSINYNISIAKFEEDEDGNFIVTVSDYDFVGDGTPKFICNTVNGIIVREQAVVSQGFCNVTYVHIDRNGNRTVMYENTSRNCLYGENFTYARYGNKLLRVSYGRNNVSGSWGFRVFAIASNDGGMTWTEFLVDGWADGQFYFGDRVCDGFIRDGTMYVIYGHVSLTAGVTHLLKSNDGITWYEIPLTNTVSIELADVGNFCDRTREGELVTIAFTPDGTQDIIACELIQTGRGEGSYNVKLKDGEFVDNHAEPFFYLMADTFAFYTESEYMIPKICWYRNQNTNIPEEVQPGDYCVRS